MLTLWLLLFQLAAPAEQWRIVQTDGAVEVATAAPRLSEAQRAKVRSAWMWSPELAPRRIETAQIGQVRFPADPARLSVRVVRSVPGKKPAALTLFAAPREMWGEVPEDSLPGWPVPDDGRLTIPVDPGRGWRLRVAGKSEGTFWVDVAPGQKSVVLASMPASGIDLTVLDAGGKAVQPVHGTLQEASARAGALRSWALLRGDRGQLTVAGLPDEQEVSLTLIHPGAPPRVLRGRASAFPREVRLSAGAELKGQVVDARGVPLARVPVEVESWASRDLPQVHRVRGKSDAQGRWRLPGLPVGKVGLGVRAPGFVPLVELLELEAGVKDLGILKLEPGVEVAVRVVGDAGDPVPGARVSAAAGRITATADGQGVARLAGLPKAPVELRGTGERHLEGSLRLNPPFPEAARLVLPRSLTLLGRLLDGAGRPVDRGSVEVDSGTCTTESQLGVGGRFELSVPPQTEGELVLRSPSTPEVRTRLAPGKAGEVRDLGDLKAPAGWIVTGRVARAEDASPLAGARVWTLRQGPQGPAVAWATRDLIETVSGEDGRFQLSGLVRAPAVLRIESLGRARAQVALALEGTADEEGTTDLGTIHLSAGSTLRVSVDPRAVDGEGAVARADVGHRWLDADMLTAAVWSGEAVLSNVPPGKVTVSVLAGRRLLCEQIVEVPTEGELGVDCRRPALQVAGQVLVGNVAAGGGTLTWQIPNPEIPGRIDNVVAPSGLRMQQVAGLGRPQVDVAVGPDGRFESADLVPGTWQVTWHAAQGAATGSLTVEIPVLERFETVLPFPGLALAGTVTDAGGKPVPGARVRELTAGAMAFSREDGSFSLVGLAPGKVTVQAQLLERSSPLAEIELLPERPPEPLVLVVGERQAPRIRIQVMEAGGGTTVPGAFVFFEEEGKGQRLLTTAADGSATVTLEAPLPARVRAAAFAASRWGWGPWTTRDAARDLPVRLDGASTLRVESERRGAARIVSEDGWDLSWMLRLLGSPPALSPDQPLQLKGLPDGRYTLVQEGVSVTVPVEAGHGEGRIE